MFLKMRVAPLLLLLLVFWVTQGQEINLQCTPDVCEEWLSKNECPKVDEECLETGRIFRYPVECGCCNYCIKYIEEGDDCVKGQPGQPTTGSICGAGLGCVLEEGSQHAVCRRLETECHAAQDKYDKDKEDGTLGHLRQKPSCDEYGDFAPAVCVPGSICFCVNPMNERIFGEHVFDSPELTVTMTCRCSSDAWRASQLMLGQDAVFSHCLPDGSYDPLQCVDNICACVDREGVPDNSRVHVSQLNDTLPACFDRELGHQSQMYKRKCEATRGHLLATQRQLAAGGATVVLSQLPTCGLDGRYDRLQEIDEDLVCTNPDGEVLSDDDGEFKVNKMSQAAIAMNCNCARTWYTLLHASENSEIAAKLPQCCRNGNFPRWMCSRGLCYCIDIHGNQLYQEVPEDEKQKLPCYFEGLDPCSPHAPQPFH